MKSDLHNQDVAFDVICPLLEDATWKILYTGLVRQYKILGRMKRG